MGVRWALGRGDGPGAGALAPEGEAERIRDRRGDWSRYISDNNKNAWSVVPVDVERVAPNTKSETGP